MPHTLLTWKSVPTWAASPSTTCAVPTQPPEQAFTLPPGQSPLTFRAVEFNPNGALTVLWRSAYW